MANRSDHDDAGQAFVEFRGLRLPPPRLRWGGLRYREDEAYLRSAEAAVDRLIGLCGLTAESPILDIGCGQGRLLVGLLARYGRRVPHYVGLDVHRPSIQWASRHLADPDRGISFHWLNYENQRYNPEGTSQVGLSLPVPSDAFSVVVLLSVFSHMRLHEITQYLGEIRRAMAPTGRAYFTAFVEDGVAEETVNPPGYRRPWSGPLHCVRLDRLAFDQRVRDAGLVIDLFRPGATASATTDGQSSYVVSRLDRQLPALDDPIAPKR